MLQMKVNNLENETKVVVEDERMRKSLVLWFGYFGVLLLLKLLRRGYQSFLRFDPWLFLVGGLVGMFVWLADKLVYVYYTRPNEESSVQIQQKIKNKEYKHVLKILWGDSFSQAHLAMNNVLFMAVWAVLGFFLLTSSPSWFARGLILGIGLQMVVGIRDDWGDKEKLMGRLFWPIKRRVGMQELQVVVMVFVGVFVFLSFLGI